VIPVALLLYRSDEVSEQRRQVGLRALESWLVRRMLCGLTAQGYNRLMADLLKSVRADLEHADEVIVRFLRDSVANSAVWPSDAMVTSFLTARYLYGYISQKRIVMVLSAIERDLRRDSKTEDIYALPTNLTVEHVMPQKWEEHWPLADGQDPGEREASINRLGNLTLTSGPLNSSLSNAPWAQKRSALPQHSLLLINQQLSSHETWDEAALDRRGEALAQLICRLWPGPEGSSWPATESLGPVAALDGRTPAVSSATDVDRGPEPRASASTVARDGRDFSRFHIIVDGEELPHENKRNSVCVMITSLFERGVSMAALAEKLGNHLKWVEGELENFVPAFSERYPKFDPVWWYTEHPFRDSGRTWLLDKAWGAETEGTLASLSAAFPQAGVQFRRAGEELTANPPHQSSAIQADLSPTRTQPWQEVGTIEGFVAKWPEGDEPFGSLTVYESADGNGPVQLALGSPQRPLNLYGRVRSWISVWQVRNGKPGRQLANFLETDDFAASGERVALINGKNGQPKVNYSPGEEELLPDIYAPMRVAVQRERIAGPNARNKLVVVAGQGETDAMLDHALTQLRLRT
jgi:hypothetical protein